MQSASTTRAVSADELSAIAKEKAIRGQPTRSMAEPVVEKQMGVQANTPVARVMAKPILGQAPASVQAPTAAPAATTGVPVPAAQKTTISASEAATILSGLQATLDQADSAKSTGWRCSSADDATFYQGRILRDRLAQFIPRALSTSVFEITAAELDTADKILACSNEATASVPNTGAYIALGVIVALTAIFFSVK
jgi:hypothetical protein